MCPSNEGRENTLSEEERCCYYKQLASPAFSLDLNAAVTLRTRCRTSVTVAGLSTARGAHNAPRFLVLENAAVFKSRQNAFTRATGAGRHCPSRAGGSRTAGRWFGSRAAPLRRANANANANPSRTGTARPG